MERPAIVYLDTPIVLHGIKVSHSKQGLEYLIEHYTHMLHHATPQQMNDAARQHCQKVIDNMNIHLELYNK